ncbi:5623_t:CDS:2, partial [Gigaspora rosea]
MSSQNDFRENNYEILTYEEPKKYTFEELQKLTFNEFKNLTMENLSNINSKEIDYLPWDVEKQKWIREGEKEVAIKVFRDAYTFSPEFLNEIKTSLKLQLQSSSFMNNIYGITYDPLQENIALSSIFNVMKMTWFYVNELFTDICEGLESIHEHPQRPQIPDYVPDPYVALIRRCWNSNPQERPIATDMRKQFQHWSVNLRGSDLSNEKDVLKIQEQKDILQAFNKNQEEKWKRRLSEISQPKFYDKLTSKYIYYTRSFSQNGHLQNKSSIQGPPKFNKIEWFMTRGKENDEHLLIIELANGGNLEHYMKGDIFNTLTWLGKIKLAKGIAEGLRFIHELGVIHRDLIHFSLSGLLAFRSDAQPNISQVINTLKGIEESGVIEN